MDLVTLDTTWQLLFCPRPGGPRPTSQPPGLAPTLCAQRPQRTCGWAMPRNQASAAGSCSADRTGSAHRGCLDMHQGGGVTCLLTRSLSPSSWPPRAPRCLLGAHWGTLAQSHGGPCEEECHLTPETALVGSGTPRVPPSRNRHRPQCSGNTGLGWALSTRDASSRLAVDGWGSRLSGPSRPLVLKGLLLGWRSRGSRGEGPRGAWELSLAGELTHAELVGEGRVPLTPSPRSPGPGPAGCAASHTPPGRR